MVAFWSGVMGRVHKREHVKRSDVRRSVFKMAGTKRATIRRRKRQWAHAQGARVKTRESESPGFRMRTVAHRERVQIVTKSMRPRPCVCVALWPRDGRVPSRSGFSASDVVPPRAGVVSRDARDDGD